MGSWGSLVHGFGSGVQGSGFRVQGSGFRVQGSRFSVLDPIVAGGGGMRLDSTGRPLRRTGVWGALLVLTAGLFLVSPSVSARQDLSMSSPTLARAWDAEH